MHNACMLVLLYNSCICVFKYKSIVIQSVVYHVQSVAQVLVTISRLPKCSLQLQIHVVISHLVFFHFFGLLTMYERIYGVQEGTNCSLNVASC